MHVYETRQMLVDAAGTRIEALAFAPHPSASNVLMTGSGTGTVTSVGLSLPGSVFTITIGTVTTSGVLTAVFASQSVNTFFAGPGTGISAGVPTFRVLTAQDLTGVAAGGDLSGTYPNPTVAYINGVKLGTTTATAGNLLVGSGGIAAEWVSVAISGDVRLTSAGVATVGTYGTHGELAQSLSTTEEITLSTSGTTTDSSANLLPGDSIIEAVVLRITQAIATATSYSVGDASESERFRSDSPTLTLGSTAIGLNHQKGSVSTDARGPVQPAAAKVRITTVGTPSAGKVRVTVFYRSYTPPTS